MYIFFIYQLIEKRNLNKIKKKIYFKCIYLQFQMFILKSILFNHG